MAWTAHGHHIPGTVKGDDRPASVARCGGPGLCKQCSQEASLNEEAKENLKKAEEVAQAYSEAMNETSKTIKDLVGPVKMEHCGLDELHGSHKREDEPGVYCPGLSFAANQGASPTFHQELVALINKHSVENRSGTPDWIIAEVMMANLRAWELGIHLRNDWRGERNNSIFDVTQEEKVKVVEYHEGRRNEIGEATITMWPGEITRHGGPVREVVATFTTVTKKDTSDVPSDISPKEEATPPRDLEQGLTPFQRYQRGLLSPPDPVTGGTNAVE